LEKPQAAQSTGKAAPQSAQNRRFGLFSVPQTLHRIAELRCKWGYPEAAERC